MKLSNETDKKHFGYAGVYLILWICFWGWVYSTIQTENPIADTPKVDLPEEYKAITPEDNLKGHFDNKGVLHIEFNNKRNQ